MIDILFILKFRDIPLMRKSLEVSYISEWIIFSVKCFQCELFFSMLKVATNQYKILTLIVKDIKIGVRDSALII